MADRTVCKLALLEVLHRQRSGSLAINVGDAMFVRQLGSDQNASRRTWTD